ncbi:MAG: molybdopterin cofactor-binding domain-containing protein [Gemmatimonadota bacterium]
MAGSDELPYAIPNRRVDYIMAPRQVPLGWWRAVGYTHNVFAFESFIDEMAHRAGEDPYIYRRRLLRDAPRHLGVLDAVADAAGWRRDAPAGRDRGIAVFTGFGSYVGTVVEASVQGGGAGDDTAAAVATGDGTAADGDAPAPGAGGAGDGARRRSGEDGAIRVHRVWCAVDCGRIVNPALVESQIQSGVVFGLTAALYGKLTLEDGGFREGNFDAYRMLRMPELPEIHPVLVESDEHPTGVGEPPVPAVAPALANAIHAAIGRRLRDLPLDAGVADGSVA